MKYVMILFILFLLPVSYLVSQDIITPGGNSWQYLNNGSDQGFEWKKSDFNDTQWKSGEAEFGYEDGDQEQPGVMRKAPYLLYTGKNKEMKICWQLRKKTSCQLSWGTDTTYSIDSVKTKEFGDNQHSFLFTNLKPNKRYYYCVNIDNKKYKGSFFSAPKSSSKNIKFMVYGDSRSFPEAHNKVANQMISTYESDQSFQSFVLVVGDLVAKGSKETYWDDEFFDPQYSNIQKLLANIPFQACIGNHDLPGDLFKKYFSYPYIEDYYWSFDYGPAHFVVFDQFKKWHYEFDKEIKWLEKDLNQCEKDWKFIILHKPGWSAGGHENDKDVQQLIQPICEKYNVAFVFAGHNHYYSRANVNGVCHITTGGAGAPLYEPEEGMDNVIKTAKVHHYCKVEIENKNLTFTAISSEGELIDSYNLILK